MNLFIAKKPKKSPAAILPEHELYPGMTRKDAKHLRRLEISLATDGMGVVMFGIWTEVKGVIGVLNAPREIRAVIQATALSRGLIAASFAAAFLSVEVVLALQLYVGLAASRDGKRWGGPKHYLAASCAMLACTILSLYTEIRSFSVQSEILDGAVSVLIEFCLAVTLIHLIINSVKLHRFRSAFQVNFDDASSEVQRPVISGHGGD